MLIEQSCLEREVIWPLLILGKNRYNFLWLQILLRAEQNVDIDNIVVCTSNMTAHFSVRRVLLVFLFCVTKELCTAVNVGRIPVTGTRTRLVSATASSILTSWSSQDCDLEDGRRRRPIRHSSGYTSTPPHVLLLHMLAVLQTASRYFNKLYILGVTCFTSYPCYWLNNRSHFCDMSPIA